MTMASHNKKRSMVFIHNLAQDIPCIAFENFHRRVMNLHIKPRIINWEEGSLRLAR